MQEMEKQQQTDDFEPLAIRAWQSLHHRLGFAEGGGSFFCISVLELQKFLLVQSWFLYLRLHVFQHMAQVNPN